MQRLQNHNEYNQDQFEIFFKQTSTYQQLLEEYTLINFDLYCQFDAADLIGGHGTNQGPHAWDTKDTFRETLKKKGIVDAVPFYYLNYLTDAAPEKIYDIGCGSNFFKNYIPNLIGISGTPPSSTYFHGDEHGWIDDNYIAQHQNFFPSAFSLVSLHWISINDIRKRVIDFMSMIKPGGRGFLSMDSYRMDDDDLDIIDVEAYVRTQLYDTPFEYLVVDIDQTQRKLLGNIRLVMQK